MIDTLLEPFRSEIGMRMLAELVLLGVVFGPLGVWVLLMRHAYAAESLAHAMLPGLVLAAVAGLPLLVGAAGGLLLGAVLIAIAARDRRVGGDLAVAVTITALTGAGALLALAPETPAGLQERLFGDLLGVRGEDVAAAGALALAGLGRARPGAPHAQPRGVRPHDRARARHPPGPRRAGAAGAARRRHRGGRPRPRQPAARRASCSRRPPPRCAPRPPARPRRWACPRGSASRPGSPGWT